jgi:hypothetical protein
MPWFRRPPAPPATQTVAVLDFSMAPRVVERRDPHTRQMRYSTKPVETEKDLRGWWFGSQDVYYNANMGRIAADVFGEAMQQCSLFNVYSRDDLRCYYADKADVLHEQLSINDKQVEQALLTMNPVSVGRELGVQKVLVGHICDSEMRHNRTSGQFSAATSFSVSLYDVATGKLEFTRNYGGVKSRRSQYSAFEEDAQRFVRDIKAQYAGR